MRTSAGWEEGSLKSEKSIRSVPLRRELVKSLTAYIANHSNAADSTALLCPGRFYGGYGDYRGSLVGQSDSTTKASIGTAFVPPRKSSDLPTSAFTTCATPQRACLPLRGCRWRGLPVCSATPTP